MEKKVTTDMLGSDGKQSREFVASAVKKKREGDSW